MAPLKKLLILKAFLLTASIGFVPTIFAETGFENFGQRLYDKTIGPWEKAGKLGVQYYEMKTRPDQGYLNPRTQPTTKPPPVDTSPGTSLPEPQLSSPPIKLAPKTEPASPVSSKVSPQSEPRLGETVTTVPATDRQMRYQQKAPRAPKVEETVTSIPIIIQISTPSQRKQLESQESLKPGTQTAEKPQAPAAKPSQASPQSKVTSKAQRQYKVQSSPERVKTQYKGKRLIK